MIFSTSRLTSVSVVYTHKKSDTQPGFNTATLHHHQDALLQLDTTSQLCGHTDTVSWCHRWSNAILRFRCQKAQPPSQAIPRLITLLVVVTRELLLRLSYPQCTHSPIQSILQPFFDKLTWSSLCIRKPRGWEFFCQMVGWKPGGLFGRTACDEGLQVWESGQKGPGPKEVKSYETKREPQSFCHP